MDINLVVLGLLIVGLTSHIAYVYFSFDETKPPSELPWVPIQVGKERSFVNQTRDAGMFIENARRTAIINSGNGGATNFKQKGSTNGSLEYYFLTSICVCPPKDVCPPAPNVIWSDGDANDEICDIVDSGGAFGGYDAIDFGGAAGNDCDI